LTAGWPARARRQGKDVFGVLPRVLAAVGSGLGALVVFAGAVYSAIRFRRGRMVGANVLIALGTALLGAGGLLNSVLGEMTGFAVTLVVGIAVLFAGFLVASSRPRPVLSPPAELQPAAPAAAAS